MYHDLIKRTLLSFLTFLLPWLAGAQSLSEKQAEAIAEQFFQQYPETRSSSNELRMVWNGEEARTRSGVEEPAFYVFNRGNGNGFVIISSAGEQQPVLGYALEGSFKAVNMPDPLRAWMRALRDQTRNRRSLTSRSSTYDLKMSGEKDLQTPDYNQISPYNDKCPILSNGQQGYTGCAITATAIVMGYHRWPDRGTGTIPSYRVDGQQYGPYVLGDPYNWDDYESIATIMLQLGIMVRAHYKPDGTSARLQTVAAEVPKYMKYNPRIHYEERSDYDKPEWDRMVRAEIDALRPIIYDGYDEVSGHAFVLDGYNDQGYFNVNWGWGGWCNGFYLLDAMEPNGSGVGANASGGYNLGQGGIFDFRPATETDGGNDCVEFIYSQTYSNGIEVNGLELPAKKGDSFMVSAGIIKNFGANTIQNDFKLVMTDAEGNLVEELASTPAMPLSTMETQLVVDRQMVNITKEVKPGYRIRIVFQSDITGKWIPVTCDPSIGPWEVVLNTDTPEPGPDPDPVGPVDENTSLRYDVQSGKVIITTLDGARVQLKEQQTGRDRSELLQHQGNVFSFKKNQLSQGVYVLIIQLDADKKELLLEL